MDKKSNESIYTWWWLIMVHCILLAMQSSNISANQINLAAGHQRHEKNAVNIAQN